MTQNIAPSGTGGTIVALLIGLFVGIGIGVLISRSRRVEPGLDPNLTANEAIVNEYRDRLETEQKRSEATVKLSTELEAMKSRVEELNRISLEADRRRVGAEAEIKTQISQMAQHNENLVNQTRAIAGALASSQTRGKYGEAALERLLEHAGLVEGEHFIRQRSAARDENSGAIPDITISMPGGSVLYIDSKFPFERFYEAFETQDEQERKQLIAAHSKDLLKHVEALSKRKYEERGASPDFVILYAPVESIFVEALKSDPALLEKVFSCGVTIATPTSMIALLRTAGYLFSRNRVAANAAEIQELAGKFLKDVSSLHEKIVTVGERLKSTLKAYNDLIPTAESTVLTAAKKMRALEVSGKAPKAIPTLSENVRELHGQNSDDDEVISVEEVEVAEEVESEFVQGDNNGHDNTF
jgi:DNA recombination protein RmuC